MRSASSSSWWKPGTLSGVTLMWSPFLLAPGIWVNIKTQWESFFTARQHCAELLLGDLFSSDFFCFNCAGGSPPPRSLQSWVTCCGLGHTPDDSTALLPHDIYALGTQENPQGEREWTDHIKATLRSYTHIDFKQVGVLFSIFFSAEFCDSYS